MLGSSSSRFLSIKNETIIGAGLDVTTPEPLNKNHPLKKFENVIITPHIAGQSDNNRERSFELLCENIRRYLYSEKLLNIVSKKEFFDFCLPHNNNNILFTLSLKSI